MTGLNRRLAAAMRTITVDPDCCRAMVGWREVSAAERTSLRQQLAAAIYDELHAGRAECDPLPGRSLGDPAVEEKFRELLPHRDTVRDVVVVTTEPDRVLVRLDGVKVWVPRARIRPAGQRVRAGNAVTVQIPASRPAISPGFFLADAGAPWTAASPVLRVYIHLTSVTTAFDVWAAVLRMLAEQGISYRAKVLSCPEMFPRRDGMVLYLAGQDLDVPRRVAALTGRARGVGAQVSVFAEPVAAGVAVGWEPADGRPAMRGLSFGEHRAAVLADGLTRHAAERGRGEPGSAAGVVRRALIEAQIDPANPARNLPEPGPRVTPLN